ncbi:DUF4004 family protein [Candidatus Acetothermia bacterium]|nr:DUF4004 family protein [Candidatus Acetothermia bacterium]MBI3643298.1 DUF4004 family protein [Candidatus Acetothermia bacterium]
MADKEVTQREPELISKKGILDKFGISYGQFYRWKRKGLIPESWFIRKSTFTGQETFLPSDKIIERIERIMKLKEDYSLEEITEMLSPESTEARFDLKELVNKFISTETLKRFQTITGHESPFPFRDVIQIAALEELGTKELAQEELRLVLSTLNADVLPASESEADWTLWVLRKEKGSSLCCIAPKSKVRFDPETQIVAQLDLSQLVEETKLSLRGI